MKSKSLITILLLAMVFISSVYFASAASFDVNIETVEKNIFPDEYAKFDITITNLEDAEQTYYLSGSHNWIQTLSQPFTNLDFNESKTATLSLKPKSVLATGKSYNVPLEIESSMTQVKRTFNLPIYLRSYDSSSGHYIPALNLYAEYGDGNGHIDPRDDFVLKLKIRNRNALNISNMTIRIDGDLFYENHEDSLLPQEEKTVQLTFDLDEVQEPGQHNLLVQIIINDNVYATLEETYSIIEYSDINVDLTKEREFLRTINKISAANEGNTPSTKVVEVQKNWIQRLFITASEPYTLAKSEGKPVMKWSIELSPQESTEITYSTNYRLLFVIILLIAIIIYLYFTYRSEVIVHKKARVLHTKNIEGVSRIKIKLFLKNRTGKKIHDVELKERLAKLTTIVEDHHTLGSPIPSKIIKAKRNTIAKWNFDHLDPYEERIITYKLESKLNLIGSVEFQRAIVKFKNVDGKIRRTRSNLCVLSFTKKKKKQQ